MIRVPEVAFVFLSQGVTVGASGIGIDASGHIIHVPGNNPEGYRMVQVGLEMASLAETIAEAGLRAEVQKSAARLVQSGRTALENNLKALSLEAKTQTA